MNLIAIEHPQRRLINVHCEDCRTDWIDETSVKAATHHAIANPGHVVLVAQEVRTRYMMGEVTHVEALELAAPEAVS